MWRSSKWRFFALNDCQELYFPYFLIPHQNKPSHHYMHIINIPSFTFGLISIVKNSLKLGCGVKLCNFFSSCTSHCGAKWTFFNMTHRPDLLEALITFSACVKPSAEPEIPTNVCFIYHPTILITRCYNCINNSKSSGKNFSANTLVYIYHV